MKRITRKTFAFATALTVLFFAAQGAEAKGPHDVRTKSGPVKTYSGSKANKKYIAHKRRKSPPGKRSKGEPANSLSMVRTEEV